MRHIFLLIGVCASFHCLAQNDEILMGAGNIMLSDETLENVYASDGVYDKFVLIRWEATDKGTYRLFRATSPHGASMCELTKSWQKSTWFCDYSAEKGRDYYYAILESDGKISAPLSRFDKGFVRKEEIAHEESLSSVTPDKYTAGNSKPLFMLVSEVVADSTTFTVGSTIPIRVGLQNIFDESTPLTEMRVYLSSNVVWDFEDRMLASKTFSGFPAGFKGVVAEKITLPAQILPGTYHLLVVVSPEGNIPNAKIGIIQINISGQ